MQRTGKPDGRHYFFSYPEGVITIQNSVRGIGSGLDIRSDGGYIVADPSAHSSGRRYQIESYAAPLAEPPAWFVGLLLERQRDERSHALPSGQGLTASSSLPAIIVGEGSRNHFLFRYGCGLVKSFSPDEKLSRLQRINETRLSTPLDERELLKLHLSSEKLYRSNH
jgi:hypothetical protein